MTVKDAFAREGLTLTVREVDGRFEATVGDAREWCCRLGPSHLNMVRRRWPPSARRQAARSPSVGGCV